MATAVESCRTARLQAVQTLSVLPPNAKPSSFFAPTHDVAVHGLSNNIGTEFHARTSLISVPQPPQFRAGIELAESTVLLARQ